MREDKTHLKEQAQETVHHLQGKIKEFEQRVANGMESVSLTRQIQKHPISAVSAAALVGFGGAYWFHKIRPTINQITHDFAPEIKTAKKIGASLLLEILSQAVVNHEGATRNE